MLHRSWIGAFVLIGLAVVTAGVNAAERSKLIGVWNLDVSKLPLPPGGIPPRSVTLRVADVGGGKWQTTIDTVNADGTKLHAESSYSLDGVPAPVTGAMDADTVSVTCPDADTLVMGAGKRGALATVRVFTVSADGKHQTETIVALGQNGKPTTRTNSWTRG